MRILMSADPEIPVPPDTYGGIERIVDSLVRELRRRGFVVGLLANRDSRCEVDAFFPWPASSSQGSINIVRNAGIFWRAVKEFKPDVVHSFSRILYMLPIMRMPLPKIMSYQREPTPWTVRAGAMLGNGSLRFTGNSEYICSNGKRAGGEWSVIYNCVDLDRYRFCGVVAKDAPLVFLSRVDRIKGAHNAIAIARAAGRRLIIAGNHATSGPEHEYWMKEIVPHIGGDIEYVGPVDDVRKNILLGQAAAMVVPIEWNEPFGIVFAESLACGTPVISSPRGALPEIVRHGVDGFLVESIADGCDAVNKLDEIDRANCRRRVEGKFSESVVATRYEKLYRDALAHDS